jgi:NitT/TauT family transport system substrate-binding protein
MKLQRRRFLQLAGAAAAVRPFGAVGATPLKMRVGSGVGLAAVQSLYAQETGMYKRHDLDVELEFPLSGKAVLERFAADRIDIGDMNILSIALEIESGRDYVIVAPGANYDSSVPTTMLVQAPSSDFHSGKDLEGKTVATLEVNDLALISVKLWIETTGGDLSKVNFVHGIPMIEVDKPLADGRIHAALIANPNLTVLLSNGSVKVLAKPFDAIGTVFTPASFFARRNWVNDNREAVRRFAAAINETAQWATTHHDETVKILASALKVPESRVAQMPHARYPGRLNLESIQRPLDAAIKYGALKPVRAQDIVVDTLKE